MWLHPPGVQRQGGAPASRGERRGCGSSLWGCQWGFESLPCNSQSLGRKKRNQAQGCAPTRMETRHPGHHSTRGWAIQDGLKTPVFPQRSGGRDGLCLRMHPGLGPQVQQSPASLRSPVCGGDSGWWTLSSKLAQFVEGLCQGKSAARGTHGPSDKNMGPSLTSHAIHHSVPRMHVAFCHLPRAHP